MITIKINEEEYELIEVASDKFLVTQEIPYKNLRSSLYREGTATIELDGMTVANPSIYMYESIRLNGKFYGFEPLNKKIWE